MKDIQSIAEIENYNWPDPVDPARFVGMGERQTCRDSRATWRIHGWSIPGIMEMAA